MSGQTAKLDVELFFFFQRLFSKPSRPTIYPVVFFITFSTSKKNLNCKFCSMISTIKRLTGNFQKTNIFNL